MKKQFIIFLLSILTCSIVFSQNPQFSLATDVSILRSFKKEQKYWAIGQTINFHFHITPKDGVYAWFSYYSDGKFTNTVIADAKSPATTPQQVNYLNKSEVGLKNISLGWKRYLKGAFNSEKKWNLYVHAGFGLMMGRIVNTHSAGIDTSAYTVPVLGGKAYFKRLTLDLGLGLEFPVGGDIYLYFEGRALVPTTDYPSNYLFINNNAPFTGAVNAGLRILFE